MKVALVVFDIAGTTVTDDNSVNDAFRGAFGKSGYPVALTEVNYIMGYRKIEAIKILLQKFYPGQVDNEELIQHIHDVFLKDMQAYYRHTPNLAALPYAEEVFRQLHTKNIKIGLDTGFTKSITDIIIERLGWGTNSMVDQVISSDEVPEGRPSPYMIQRIMEAVKITDPKQVVKVGDTEVDIAEGRNAGCGLVVSVTTGSYTREELQKYAPDHIIESLNELAPLLHLDS